MIWDASPLHLQMRPLGPQPAASLMDSGGALRQPSFPTALAGLEVGFDFLYLLLDGVDAGSATGSSKWETCATDWTDPARRVLTKNGVWPRRLEGGVSGTTFTLTFRFASDESYTYNSKHALKLTITPATP